MVTETNFWSSKRVLLTGHTGFKGGWLTVWLHSMGARVHGYSLAPPTDPSMYEVCNTGRLLEGEIIADIRDVGAIRSFFDECRPEIVFHLAAQSLVRKSYLDPLETLASNVMGTANILEACRECSTLRAIVNVTSDKCYANNEDGRAFTESDPMGGHDIYSASKGAVELVAAAYQQAFLNEKAIPVGNVRAGNVIGGGDWASDRLVPDYFRAIEAGQPLVIRSPESVRPWQHVLEPLSGYLALAERLYTDGGKYQGGWNFGPSSQSVKTVRWIVDYLVKANGGEVIHNTGNDPSEALLLSLDSSKAHECLNWAPRWGLCEALDRTAQWERSRLEGADMLGVTRSQIEAYTHGG